MKTFEVWYIFDRANIPTLPDQLVERWWRYCGHHVRWTARAEVPEGDLPERMAIRLLRDAMTQIPPVTLYIPSIKLAEHYGHADKHRLVCPYCFHTAVGGVGKIDMEKYAIGQSKVLAAGTCEFHCLTCLERGSEAEFSSISFIAPPDNPLYFRTATLETPLLSFCTRAFIAADGNWTYELDDFQYANNGETRLAEALGCEPTLYYKRGQEFVVARGEDRPVGGATTAMQTLQDPLLTRLLDKQVQV